VLDAHRDMLANCLKECMLSNAKLLAVWPFRCFELDSPSVGPLTSLGCR